MASVQHLLSFFLLLVHLFTGGVIAAPVADAIDPVSLLNSLKLPVCLLPLVRREW